MSGKVFDADNLFREFDEDISHLKAGNIPPKWEENNLTEEDWADINEMLANPDIENVSYWFDSLITNEYDGDYHEARQLLVNRLKN